MENPQDLVFLNFSVWILSAMKMITKINNCPVLRSYFGNYREDKKRSQCWVISSEFSGSLHPGFSFCRIMYHYYTSSSWDHGVSCWSRR